MGIQIPDRSLICKGNILNQCIYVTAIIGDIFDSHLKIVIHQDHIRSGNTFFSCHTGIFPCFPAKEIKRLNLRMAALWIIKNFSRNVSQFDMIYNTIALLI